MDILTKIFISGQDQIRQGHVDRHSWFPFTWSCVDMRILRNLDKTRYLDNTNMILHNEQILTNLSPSLFIVWGCVVYNVSLFCPLIKTWLHVICGYFSYCQVSEPYFVFISF